MSSTKYPTIQPTTMEELLTSSKWCLWHNAKLLQIDEEIKSPTMTVTQIGKNTIAKAIFDRWQTMNTEQNNNDQDSTQTIPPPINQSEFVEIPINGNIINDTSVNVKSQWTFIDNKGKQIKISGAILNELNKWLNEKKFIIIDDNDKNEDDNDEKMSINVSDAMTFVDLLNAMTNFGVFILDIDASKYIEQNKQRAVSKFCNTKLSDVQWNTNQFVTHFKRLESTTKQNGTNYYLFNADFPRLIKLRAANNPSITGMKYGANGLFGKSCYAEKLEEVNDKLMELCELVIQDELKNKPVGIAMSMDDLVKSYQNGEIEEAEYIKKSMLLISQNSKAQLNKKVSKKSKNDNNNNNTNTNNNSIMDLDGDTDNEF